VVVGTIVVAALAAVIVVFVLRKRYAASSTEHSATLESQSETVRTQQKEMLLEAKDEALRIRRAAEEEIRELRAEVTRQERRIQQKEENLDRKIDGLERRERQIQRRETETEETRQETEVLKTEQRRELERVAALTGDEAKALLLARVEVEIRDIASRRVREIEQEMKEEGDRRAREIWRRRPALRARLYRRESPDGRATAERRYEGPITAARARYSGVEQATGCDLIVDDTLGGHPVGFDPVRREIARRSRQAHWDGRIPPARFEEFAHLGKLELETVILEEGERAVYEANVQGLHADLIKLLGRLKYRTSYGQNMLQHAIECSFIAGSIASEIGADVLVAKTAALLHDIGKAVDHEVEGPHALIGADIARRLGRSPKVVHAIAAHHYEEEPQTVEAFIVAVADAISGGRPGARRETVESYIKRLEALEEVANSFDGVERCFAIQAGREVRIMVKPGDVDDLGAARLARDVVKKIEESLEYPGQIKVTVIRETRAVDFAR
jgi:ribonuclease Y